MPKFGQLVDTGVWDATTRTLSDFSAEQIFDLPLIDLHYGLVQPISSATADTFGSWVQISADVGTGKRLLYITLREASGAAVFNCELQFSSGASGSEVVMGRVNVASPGPGTTCMVIPLWLALTDNQRLAVRVRDNDATTRGYNLGINVA